MNVSFLLRSRRLKSSSQAGPQNSLSNDMGVEHTMQCLCFGMATFASGFMYFDIKTDASFLASLINSVEALLAELPPITGFGNPQSL